jgi:NADH dehydrogenase
MILVVGATGQLGGSIARTLLSTGREVRVLARTGSASESLEAAGADVSLGDLKSPATLDDACDGVDVVVTTANSARREGADNTETVDTLGNRALIDAARQARVKQFVFVSAFGAAPDSPVPFLRAKGLTEAHLRSSGVPYTILAPDVFMDVWIPMIVGGPVMSGKPVTIVGEGRRKHAFIASADVAAFALASIGHPAATNRQLSLGGPTAVSWRDVIAIFERALSREIPVVTLTPGQPMPGLPETVGHLMTGLDAYDSPIEMAETARTFGVKQIGVEEYVAGLIGGARSS